MVIHPYTTESGIRVVEVWLKPFQGDPFQAGLHEDYFGMVSPKGFGVILEVKLALHQKGIELVRVSVIKSVRVVHFGACRRQVMVRLASFGQVMNGPGKCKEQIVIRERW